LQFRPPIFGIPYTCRDAIPFPSIRKRIGLKPDYSIYSYCLQLKKEANYRIAYTKQETIPRSQFQRMNWNAALAHSQKILISPYPFLSIGKRIGLNPCYSTQYYCLQLKQEAKYRLAYTKQEAIPHSQFQRMNRNAALAHSQKILISPVGL
jgi:hypothetical protein